MSSNIYNVLQGIHFPGRWQCVVPITPWCHGTLLSQPWVRQVCGDFPWRVWHPRIHLERWDEVSGTPSVSTVDYNMWCYIAGDTCVSACLRTSLTLPHVSPPTPELFIPTAPYQSSVTHNWRMNCSVVPSTSDISVMKLNSLTGQYLNQ